MDLKRDEYHEIKDEISFLTNSLVRIKILICLYEKGASVKEIKEKTNTNYSSVTSNINKLDEKGYVIKKQDKYYLKTSTRIKLINILSLNENLKFLNEYEDFLNDHDMKALPQEAFAELPVMRNVELIQSDRLNPFKATDTYKRAMTRQGRVCAICSYLHPECKRIISAVMEQETGLNLMVYKEVAKYIQKCAMNYQQHDEIRNKYFNIKRLDYEPKIAMVVSEKEIVLSFHRIEGVINKNSCFISTDQTAINWGYNLFKEFERNDDKKYVSMQHLILEKLSQEEDEELDERCIAQADDDEEEYDEDMEWVI